MPKKQPKLPLPTSDAQVNEYITALAEARIAADRATAKANERLAAVNAALAAELAPHQQMMSQYAEALFKYFEKNKDALTDGGKRESCVFATGIIGQRRTPPRTKITDEAAVLDYLRKHGLSEFFEEKPVLRRDAMLANQAEAKTVPGVTFVQDRIVFVRPDEFDVTIDLQKKIEPAK